MKKLMLCTVLVLSLAACTAKRMALEKMSKADLAVKQAEQTEASTHANLELNMAQQKLDGAKKAMDDREYKDVCRLSEEALVNAELASAKAQNAKVQENLTEARKSNEALREETQRSRSRLENR